MIHRTELIRFGWCLHCETVWPKDYLREDQNGFFYCPGRDCNGSPLDLWDYDSLLEKYANRTPPRDDMPFEPETGAYVPLYPSSRPAGG